MVNEPIDSSSVADLPAPSFPVVGIGASAGGLAAFEAFFTGMPELVEPGMAFVVVQHLAPDHKSILADILRRCTKMQVFEVEDGMLVQANCVYIIPPDRDMAFLNGTLQLLEPSAPRGLRLPIDFFFRSLAQDHRSLAIGIILSGTGNDGTQGIRAIKAEGGMVMVQSIESCDFDGMPRSVINTGLADYELAPKDMPEQLITYTKHSLGRLAKSTSRPVFNEESAMKKVFVLLRAQTGHDFSLYKPSTIHRRIDRRMAVHQIDGLENYVKYLQQSPAEVETLFRELLIGVTNFFRDPEVFHVLESQVIPKIFADKSPGSVIRVWVSGCSTGEEAYSIAILMLEHMEAIKANFTVQLFATDIDSRSIAVARAGLYPASIASDVTPERLARFFTLEADGSAYRIHKTARDLIVFSEQDVLKDPPFSKLDLITCRNLLIYMGLKAQKRLVPLFHYALKPEGFLLLGTSEGVGEFDNLFNVLDRKAKLYRRKEHMHGLHRMSMGRFMPHQTGTTEAVQFPAKQGIAKLSTTGTKSLREITEQALLDQVIAAGVLVNHHGDILYLHGRSGMFLEPSPGESGINNVLKMARQGLRHELTSSLHEAVGTRTTVSCPGLSVKTNGHFTTVNLTVRPVTTSGAADNSLFLVILEEAPVAAPALLAEGAANSQAASSNENSSFTTDALIASLRAELRSKEEYLQCTIEELESSSEELKSSNEEMQAVNEELQSTNEELQSSNEE
ncbi:MAG: chemotaxis protein CheB, partial [Pirellula sp.]